MAWGDELNQRALRTYAHCTELDEWPGYDAPPELAGVHRLSLPGWQVSAYEALIGESA